MIDRRGVLRGVTGATVALTAPHAWADENLLPRRWVKIVFVHTGERFNKPYYWDSHYIMTAVEDFSWTCRDFRAGKWKILNPWLLDLVFILHWIYNKDEIKILSGYRTAETNAQLEGAALQSQHTLANALDIHIPDVDHDALARDFKERIRGGVGMYPNRHFTHMDFGPLRSWVG
ncbi:MAG TPA: DUF882 domain-containing protein [Stellaceae bacterium]|jgi:uncharacterized protein YcbK (DUF882 family)|nr:DUF882 domain-containing protein [Stellaceae bacterium]